MAGAVSSRIELFPLAMARDPELRRPRGTYLWRVSAGYYHPTSSGKAYRVDAVSGDGRRWRAVGSAPLTQRVEHGLVLSWPAVEHSQRYLRCGTTRHIGAGLSQLAAVESEF